MTTREKNKEKRRWEILYAGLDLFVNNGYSATKTSDIAKVVNMSEGLLFHYFSTKEKLYEELVQIGMDNSKEWLDESLSSPLDFFGQLTEQILFTLKEAPQKGKFFVLMAQALRSSSTPQGVLNILAAQENRYEQTVRLIEEGQRKGEIRSGDPKALAYAYWCSIQGMAEQIAISPQTPFPKAEWFVGIIEKPKGE